MDWHFGNENDISYNQKIACQLNQLQERYETLLRAICFRPQCNSVQCIFKLMNTKPTKLSIRLFSCSAFGKL